MVHLTSPSVAQTKACKACIDRLTSERRIGKSVKEIDQVHFFLGAVPFRDWRKSRNPFDSPVLAVIIEPSTSWILVRSLTAWAVISCGLVLLGMWTGSSAMHSTAPAVTGHCDWFVSTRTSDVAPDSFPVKRPQEDMLMRSVRNDFMLVRTKDVLNPFRPVTAHFKRASLS